MEAHGIEEAACLPELKDSWAGDVFESHFRIFGLSLKGILSITERASSSFEVTRRYLQKYRSSLVEVSCSPQGQFLP
jgi:hypothetical protein